MNSLIIIEAPAFGGFYESLWDGNSQVSYEVESMASEGKSGEEISNIIGSIDWNAYQLEASKRFSNEIIDILSKDFTTIKSGDFSELNKPKEYNFRTDIIYIYLEVDYKLFLEQLFSRFSEEDITNYVKANYSTSSGFVSFVGGDWKEWKKTILNKGDRYEAMLSAVIAFVYQDSAMEIEDSIYESLTSNGFSPLEFTTKGN